jgi:hypothetical protein
VYAMFAIIAFACPRAAEPFFWRVPFYPLSSPTVSEFLKIQVFQSEVAHCAVFRFGRDAPMLWSGIEAVKPPGCAPPEPQRSCAMPKKQDTVLTEMAGRIGSALGIIAAEAAKVVRPLRTKRVKRSRAHSPNLKPRATSPARPARHRSIRKRTKRSS